MRTAHQTVFSSSSFNIRSPQEGGVRGAKHNDLSIIWKVSRLRHARSIYYSALQLMAFKQANL